MCLLSRLNDASAGLFLSSFYLLSSLTFMHMIKSVGRFEGAGTFSPSDLEFVFLCFINLDLVSLPVVKSDQPIEIYML
jgi:hypothetical protein